MSDHPDHEQLAAFQGGDGDRRQRSAVEAHLAGCPSCAEVVASVEQARSRLALLEEPALPSGLHDRLAAAVEGEAAQAAATSPASRQRRRAGQEPPAHATSPERPRSTRESPARPVPWYRRPVAWGAAAALLLAALVVPFLNQYGGGINSTASRDNAGGGAAQEASAAGAGRLPVIRIPGEVSAATVRSRLAADTQAKAALDAAGGGGTAASRDSLEAPGAPAAPDQDGGEAYRSSAPAPQAGTADLPGCLPAATAAADPASRPLVPAFYVDGAYQGREATILVTTSTGEPGRVDLWVFPRGNCSAPPLATERVR